MEKIYLDHAATTQTAERVIQTMVNVMEQHYGNPSSIHFSGRDAAHYLLNARESLGASIGANAEEIVFTSGGTEGNNLAIRQLLALENTSKRHIITTAAEHPAVLNTMKYMESQGFEVTYLPLDEKGRIYLKQVEKAIRSDTALVSVMMGNNETGTLFPVQAIGSLLAKREILFHIDAVQAYGILPIDVRKLQVDYLSISGHKIGGPRGVGFLYMRRGVPQCPILFGGEQEQKRRAGTENVPGICGLAQASELLEDTQKEIQTKRFWHFQEIICDALRKNNIGYKFNGDWDHKLPQIVNLWLIGVPSNLLLMNLDLAGFAVSTGSACSAGNVEPSHVLQGMYGENHPAVTESIRISFGKQTTAAEIMKFATALVMAVQRLKNNKGV